ncbi:hypothetical protein SAMN05428975_2581 [Mucilaginibacter sp. OK268]|uniref:hypothetical protein n=1 Tax=Mucilaginibacter sp. OK268 TaxID=1881048 RepID=UPI0008903D5A|nr:hypothetical protein [Mucilaginibacter sp. OK268]SDP76280.1 hypothetical protein SAMN05428975_2581 [Mucilaginibacter sp. OK268]
MPDGKNFWTTVPGIITGLAAIVTAITGLIVALNGAGLFSKSATANKATTETKQEVKKDVDSLAGKQAGPQKPVEKFKPVFAMTTVKIEDHEYKILGSSLEAITPESNALKIEIKYKNNSNYSPATFWNEGFRLAIDGSLTAPSGDLSELVERHAELAGTVTFEVPNNAKDLALHILDVGKDISIPIELVPD